MTDEPNTPDITPDGTPPEMGATEPLRMADAASLDDIAPAPDPLGETVTFAAVGVEPEPPASADETVVMPAVAAPDETVAMPAVAAAPDQTVVMPAVETPVATATATSGRSRAVSNAAKRKSRRKMWISLLAVVLVLALGAGGYAAWRLNRVAQRLKPAESVTKQVGKVLVAPPPKSEPLYILLMGDDKRPNQGRQRSDTMLLARLDREKKDISLLSIPRDTRIEIPGHGLDKINAAYSYGGPALAIETVKEFTGLPVHHYMEIDFIGLTKVVDAMGGITINVDRTINDRHGDVDGVGSVTHISKGVQKLDGEAALTYVRSRNFAEGDLIRIQHQQTFLKALAKQALDPSQGTRIPAILDSVSANLKTDMKVGDLTALAMDFRGATDGMKTYTISGKGAMIGGVWYLIVDTEDYRRIMGAYTSGEATASASWR